MNIIKNKYHHGNLRDEILKAAYNFVSENGYTSMSLRCIAENCDVSATAIYRHYKTKEHLLADVVVKGFTEFNIFVEGDLEANIFDKCDNYLEFAFDNKNIYDLLFSQSVVEFLKLHDVEARPPKNTSRRDGAIAGAITGMAGADVGGDAFLIQGQSKQHSSTKTNMED